MDFKSLFSEYREVIKKNLEEIVDKKKRDYESRFGKNDEFFKIFKDFLTSGKMIRGSLFLLSAESNGYKKDKSLLAIACSLELMHSALLIHDDIMDNDELRRGEKTIFAKYKQIARDKKINDPEHYGISMGIVVGDIALFTAEEITSSYDNPNLQKLLKFYTQELRFVGIGQMLDFDYGAKDKEITIEDIEKMYIYKSARYSFSLPFVLGAIAADKGDNDLKKMEQLGEKLGLIFQLIDDDIGMFGSAEEIGKPIGSDIKENKKTFLRALLMERVDNEKKEKLNKIFGNKEISKNDIEKIKEMLIDLRVRDDIKNIIDKLYEESADLINSFGISSDYKKIYLGLLDYNTKRSF